MKSKTSFWQRMGLQEWFLKKDGDNESGTPELTPQEVYKYILQKFDDSIKELSFADRIVFYHEYIIVFSAEEYKQFMDNKKGIFGLIIQESIKKFYEVLKKYRLEGKTVEPSSSKWVFRFVSHPDYVKGDKGFIGKLLPGTSHKEENVRITFIPRQTGIAESADISKEVLNGFTFYSEGYYEVPYHNKLVYDPKESSTTGEVLARFEAILPDKEYVGKKLEYFMKQEDIFVSGKDDTPGNLEAFRIPSDWVNTPHLRIRYSKGDGKLYLASFGEKTILNEKKVDSSNINSPAWTELPINSKLVLNGIVGINIFKS